MLASEARALRKRTNAFRARCGFACVVLLGGCAQAHTDPGAALSTDPSLREPRAGVSPTTAPQTIGSPIATMAAGTGAIAPAPTAGITSIAPAPSANPPSSSPPAPPSMAPPTTPTSPPPPAVLPATPPPGPPAPSRPTTGTAVACGAFICAGPQLSVPGVTLPPPCCVDAARGTCGTLANNGVCLPPPPPDPRCPSALVFGVELNGCCTFAGFCGIDATVIGAGCLDPSMLPAQDVPAPRRCDG
jgi:hypothetical protein